MTDHGSTIGRWISVLHRFRQNYLGKVLEPYHIGSGQYFFLMVLAKNDGISQEELSDYIRIDKATTAKAIKKLEDEGYVMRTVDSMDKRAYRVYLTPKGVELLPIIESAVQAWECQATFDLTEPEKALAEVLLRKMAQTVTQERRGTKD